MFRWVKWNTWQLFWKGHKDLPKYTKGPLQIYLLIQCHHIKTATSSKAPVSAKKVAELHCAVYRLQRRTSVQVVFYKELSKEVFFSPPSNARVTDLESKPHKNKGNGVSFKKYNS